MGARFGPVVSATLFFFFDHLVQGAAPGRRTRTRDQDQGPGPGTRAPQPGRRNQGAMV